MADRRGTDASRLSFPLQLVLQLGALVVAMVVTIYTAQGSMRSDLRDIQTRLELGRDIAKAQTAAQDVQLTALKASVDSTSATMKAAIESVSKKQELQALQIAELSDKITKLSAERK
jgi:hypothetical protein